MRRYRKNFPDDPRWFEQEINVFAKFCWKKFGLGKGSIISALIISPVILGMVYLASDNPVILGFFFGIYYVVLVVHFHAHTSLNKLIKRRDEKMMKEELEKEMKKLKRKRHQDDAKKETFIK
jgi:hypothetical protein